MSAFSSLPLMGRVAPSVLSTESGGASRRGKVPPPGTPKRLGFAQVGRAALPTRGRDAVWGRPSRVRGEEFVGDVIARLAPNDWRFRCKENQQPRGANVLDAKW